METFFASPERSNPEELNRQIAFASSNAVITGVLCAVQGVLAVLNEHRQVVAVNETLLRALGIGSAKDILGLRPGEMVKCIHSSETAGGCGTSKHCRTCGAAISILASQQEGAPVEERCVLSVARNGEPEDIVFNVRACPLSVEGRQFTMFFMHEVTEEERRVALERTFFHDVNNIVNGLTLASDIIGDEVPSDLAKDLRILVRQLRAEIDIQNAIARHGKDAFSPNREQIDFDRLLEDLGRIVEFHPAAIGKRLITENQLHGNGFVSDQAIITRIITNMLVNAFEASAKGDTVRLSLRREGNDAVFSVWNRAVIPFDYTLRLFQYQFSTKGGSGRGLGAYSMKLLGERILGGRVGFATSEALGTEFFLRLPTAMA